MKKKLSLLFAASLLTAAMLSACGTAKQTDNSSAATSSTSSTAASTGKTIDIAITAKSFQFDKKEIHVKKGDKVKVTLTSADSYHGFEIPDYNFNLQGNQSGEFTANKAGTFEYHCSIMCGAGHTNMTGKLIVS